MAQGSAQTALTGLLKALVALGVAQKKITNQFLVAVAPINAATQALRQFAGVADLSLTTGAAVSSLKSVGAAVTSLGGDIRDAGALFGKLDAWLLDIKMGGAGGNLNNIAIRYGLVFDNTNTPEERLAKINAKMNDLKFNPAAQRGLQRELGLSEGMFRLLTKSSDEFAKIIADKDKFNPFPKGVYGAEQGAVYEAATARSLRFREACNDLNQAFEKWKFLLADLLTRLTPFIELLADAVAYLADNKAALYAVAAVMGGLFFKSLMAVVHAFKAFSGIQSISAFGLNNLAKAIFLPKVAFAGLVSALTTAKTALAAFAAQMAAVNTAGLIAQLKAMGQTLARAGAGWAKFGKLVLVNIWGIISALVKLAIATITNPFFLILAGIMAIVAAFKYCGVAVGFLTTAVVALGVALWASGIAEIIAIIVAIIAAIIAVGYAVTHWEETVESLAKVWHAFVDWWMGVWDGIVGIWNGICDSIGRAWDSCCSWIKDAFNSSIRVLSDAIDGWVTIFTSAFDWLEDVFGRFWDWLFEEIPFLADLFNDPIGTIKGVWDGLVEYLFGIWDSICGIFRPAVDFFGDIFTRAAAKIKEKLFGAFDSVKEKWNKVKGWFGFGDDEKKDESGNGATAAQPSNAPRLHETLAQMERNIALANGNLTSVNNAAAGYSQMQMITRTNQNISNTRTNANVKMDGGIHIHTTANTIEGITRVGQDELERDFNHMLTNGVMSVAAP